MDSTRAPANTGATRTDRTALTRVLRLGRNSAFGREHGFQAIRTIAEYQARVPLASYDDIIPYINQIAAGAASVLTAQPVDLLEPSSGSAAARKLIPYTKGLRQDYARAVRAWLWDLNRNFPRLRKGQVYFTITPAGTAARSTPGGVPIGFADDSAYLGRFLGRYIARRSAVPLDVVRCQDMDEFWGRTVAAVQRAHDLRFLSIWNPTFLLLMIERSGLAPDQLFPDLELISCWADAGAAPGAAELMRLFPQARLQPKGLLATEGAVTIPIEGLGKRLAGVHFTEFIDQGGEPKTADQLDIGGEYEVVLSTSGGLYRYRLGDMVEYRGRRCFEFLGKAADVVDRFGEKLNEAHVRQVVGADKGFRLLTPQGRGYVLYSDAPLDAEAIDEGLRKNFHYDHCRRLGQLDQVRVIVTTDGAREYIDNCLRFGQRLGDIKPLCLTGREGWRFTAARPQA
ncbi:MAG: GH3 auxin-responsive promoter family protein [Bifidobacteriaceae bacterium]|jgi:hypothetical protein|nr:GH3 auxin-responsive promoter family protein [Bifidobacteriaceae bacterium]